MTRYGLVVEGTYDEAALAELVRRCAPGPVDDVVSRLCNRKGDLMKKFPIFLQEFHEAGGFYKAIVVRDADRRSTTQLLTEMRGKVANRTYSFLVEYVVVVRELEAWLLADERALSQITGRPIARISNPGKIKDPKEKLTNVLSSGKVSYTQEIARKIAANAEVKVMESRCPSFKKFRRAVKDC